MVRPAILHIYAGYRSGGFQNGRTFGGTDLSGCKFLWNKIEDNNNTKCQASNLNTLMVPVISLSQVRLVLVPQLPPMLKKAAIGVQISLAVIHILVPLIVGTMGPGTHHHLNMICYPYVSMNLVKKYDR